MKQKIKNIVEQAEKAMNIESQSIKITETGGAFDRGFSNAFEVTETKIQTHGDYSTNIAMLLASSQKTNPREIAAKIIEHIKDKENLFEKIEIAGPGFINFFINNTAWHPILGEIHKKGDQYGATNIGKGQKIQVEFVSANPTGPLHIGHGRGAAIGDTISNILLYCGYNVLKEYYVNDSGKQINTLGLSVYLRYKELFGKKIDFPDDCYQGEYIYDLAKEIKEIKNQDFLNGIDEDNIKFCAKFAANKIKNNIDNDLKLFGINIDNWFSEQSLYDSNSVNNNLNDLIDKGIVYKKDGAFWFKTSTFGDEKDRVVIRSNGETTYFASDIAYHKNKFQRGFEKVINIWGADHHGYIPRVEAAVEALGFSKKNLKIIIVQFVSLMRNNTPVAMSTRSGEFITLNDVITEVGRDAARFIFLTRRYDNTLDFDLELAKKQNNDNPVYYVQYVHARISSIIKKAKKDGLFIIKNVENHLSDKLNEPQEIELIKILSRYPEVICACAEFLEPHRITFYLMNLASCFHSYYNKHKVLSDDKEITICRLYLILAVKQVINNGLKLLGVSAPEEM